MSDPAVLDGWGRPRPLKITFIVCNCECIQEILNIIFRECYSRWGGINYLICIAEDKKLLGSSWDDLVQYDPDYVYSYTTLDNEIVKKIDSEVCPAEIIFHGGDICDQVFPYDYEPIHLPASIGSLSVVSYLVQEKILLNSNNKITLIDYVHPNDIETFIQDNIGVLSYRNKSPRVSDKYKTLLDLEPIIPNSKSGHFPEEKELLSELTIYRDELEVLKALTKSNYVTAAYLSSIFAWATNDEQKFKKPFRLIVGEEYKDRIFFWNHRGANPSWHGNPCSIFILPLKLLNKESFFSLLTDFLSYHNRQRNENNQFLLEIISTSVDRNVLNEIKEKFEKKYGRSWNITTDFINDITVSNKSNEYCNMVPYDTYRFSPMIEEKNWRKFSWTSPLAFPSYIVPFHISSIASSLDNARGHWIVDFKIEYNKFKLKDGNPNIWVLPKKLRLHEAFILTELNNDKLIPNNKYRVNCHGQLSVLVNLKLDAFSINVPTIQHAINSSLHNIDMVDIIEPSSNSFEDTLEVVKIIPSNEAKYLIGVLELAGGLKKAQELFLNESIMELFAYFGGTTAYENIKLDIDNLVIKRFKDKTVDFKNSNERSVVSKLLFSMAKNLWKDNKCLSLEQARESWGQQSDFADKLKMLRNRSLLYQGAVVTCKRCSHKNWLDIEGMTIDPYCEVCKEKLDLPVDIKWQFKANEFLIISLQRSVLSILWFLKIMENEARQSFIYLEPSELNFKGDSKEKREIDLVLLIDGKIYQCEIKSSWRNANKAVLKDQFYIGNILCPDEIVLGVMSDKHENKIRELNKYAKENIPLDIKFDIKYKS